MRDIFFLAYLVTLFVGIAALVTALFLYLRFRKAVLLYYFLFLTAVTMVFIINTVLQYGAAGSSEYRWQTFSVLVGGCAYLLLVFAAPMFVHELLGLPAGRMFRYGVVLNCAVIAGLAAAFLVSRREVLYALVQVAFLPSVVYALALLFLHYRSVEQKLLRKAIRSFLIISASLLPFIVIDIFSARIPGVNRVVPEQTSFSLLLFFLVWNMVNLTYSERYFFRPVDADPSFLRSSVQESYSVTDREYTVIEMLLDGKANKEIASDLRISEQTVKNHLYSIYKKTGVFSRVELINKLNGIQKSL